VCGPSFPSSSSPPSSQVTGRNEARERKEGETSLNVKGKAHAGEVERLGKKLGFKMTLEIYDFDLFSNIF